MGDTRRVLGIQRDLSEVVGEAVNSAYCAGKDINILLDEVLNNDIRAVFIYGDFDGSFSDVDMYSLSMIFRRNVSVLALTISGVDIGDDVMSHLCESLLHSNVQYIDLSSTPLDEEAGRSLAALAHNNHSLRTVIVEDTLVSEEIIDEIDVACQFNETWPVVIPHLHQDRVRLCVAHIFDSCPNGEYCIFSHDSSEVKGKGGKKADWSKALSGDGDVPTGASWRGTDQAKFTIKKGRIKELTQAQKKEKGNSLNWTVISCLAGVLAAATLLSLRPWRRFE